MMELHVVQSSWLYFMHGYKTIEGIFSTEDRAYAEKTNLDEKVSKNHLGYIMVRTDVTTITLDQPIDIDKYTKPLKGEI